MGSLVLSTQMDLYHYTSLEMKALGMPQGVKACREMVFQAFDECMLKNGGINFAKSMVQSDVSKDGMILYYAAFFCPDEPRVEKLAEYIQQQRKADGGYTWDPQAKYSGPHTTICVLEGFSAYLQAGFSHLAKQIRQSIAQAVELLLSRLLLISEETRFMKLAYPYRYRYNLLRALEFLASNNWPYDGRMAPALWWLADKQADSGLWHLEHIHPGNVHFMMEEKGQPSRFIILKALLIQKFYHSPETKDDIFEL